MDGGDSAVDLYQTFSRLVNVTGDAIQPPLDANGALAVLNRHVPTGELVLV